MTRCRKLAACLSAAAAGAVAIPALADETIVYTVPVTSDTYYYVAPARDYYYVAPTDDRYVAPSTDYYYVPSSSTYYYEPAIVVTAPRDEDAAITNDVVDTLALDPRISGDIGVETYRGNVALNGRVTTTSQVELAGTDARSVAGVRDVSNNLRARVGNE